MFNFVNMKIGLVFEKYPLFPLAFFLILGIVTGSEMCGDVEFSQWFFMLVVNVLLCLMLNKFRTIQTLLILSSLFLLGGTLCSRVEAMKNIPIPGYNENYKGVVASEPIERGKTVCFDVQITDGVLVGKLIKVSLLKDSISSKYKMVKVNDGIIFKTKLSSHKNYYDSNFDYADYLYNHGFIAQALVYPDDWLLANISLKKLTITDRARIKALRFRHEILQKLRIHGLDEQVYAVVAAMVMGDKSSLSKDIRNAYSKTGVSHILALSGLHLGIIYAIISFVSFRRRYKTFGSIILICSIWSYVFLVGMMPSVVRSALMLSIMTLVGLTGRNPMSLNVLSFAAIVMLMGNPLMLYDIGFQLSFLAVAFIVSFHSTFNCLLPIKYQQSNMVVRWCWQLVLVSTLAQLGTMPVVVYYFSAIPLLSLLGNFVVIPLATIILYLSLLMIVFSFINSLGYVLTLLLTFVVSFMNKFVYALSSLSFSSIDDVDINCLQVVIIYILILCTLFLLKILLHRRV